MLIKTIAMKFLKTFRLRASSLGETVIAMALISICLGMTLIVYGRVISSSENISSYLAEQKVKQLIYETEEEQLFEDEDFEYGSYKVLKRVERDVEGQLSYVTFIILNNGKKRQRRVLLKRYE